MYRDTLGLRVSLKGLKQPEMALTEVTIGVCIISVTEIDQTIPKLQIIATTKVICTVRQTQGPPTAASII